MQKQALSTLLFWNLCSVILNPSAFAGNIQNTQQNTQIDQFVRQLNGKIVFCQGEQDKGGLGFRFDDWIAYVNNAQPSPYVSINFVPHFYTCVKTSTNSEVFYQWEEDATFRSENHLIAGIYEKGFWNSERIQFMDQAEFSDLNDPDQRLYLRYPMKDFLSEKEWEILRKTKTLSKSGIFFPWSKASLDSPDVNGGVPSDLYLNASWYNLSVTFVMNDDQTIMVSQVSEVYR